MRESTRRPQPLTPVCRTRQRSGMRWDDRLGALFDDLEQQAEGLVLAERDAEVAELSRAEYAHVDLAARLHGSLGTRLRVSVSGVGVVDGLLSRAGDGWCLLDATPQEWIVRLAVVGSMRGLVDRGVAAQARPVTARLGFASALRGVADARVETVVHLVDGALVRGELGRVGADFVELRSREGRSGGAETVPFAAIAAVRSS